MLSARLARSLALRDVHYGWIMVAITFVTMLATAAAMGMPGLLLVALHGEFGWSDSAISGALATRLLMFGLMGPFAASLIQRHGVRATTCCALLLIVTGLAITMGATALWQFWLGWGLLVGLGTGATAVVLGAASCWGCSRRAPRRDSWCSCRSRHGWRITWAGAGPWCRRSWLVGWLPC